MTSGTSEEWMRQETTRDRWPRVSSLRDAPHEVSTKQLDEALDEESRCFKFIVLKLSSVTITKLRAGLLGRPQIRQLIRDDNLTSSMDEVGARA